MVNKLTPPPSLPDPQDLRAVIAYNMRLYRVNHGWSQEELARQCGLDRTYVSAVERKRWNIALSNIEKSHPRLKSPLTNFSFRHKKCSAK